MKKYRAAIIGYGIIADTGHSLALLHNSGIEVVAVCDVTAERLVIAKRKFPLAKTFCELDEMLLKASLDFVIICSPPRFHERQITRCLQADLNVVCEKPVLLNVDDYDSIEALAKSKQKAVYPCSNYKFSPSLKSVREIILSNEIGVPRNLYINTLRRSHALGCKEWNKDWRRKSEISGGGILMDHGFHSIYVSSFLLGSTPIQGAGFLGKKNPSFETEDVAAFTIKYGDETFSHVYLTWNSRIRSTKYYLECETGTLLVDDYHFIVKNKGQVLTKDVNSDTSFRDPGHVKWYQEMYQDFLNRLDNLESQHLLSEAKACTKVIQEIYSQNRGFSHCQ